MSETSTSEVLAERRYGPARIERLTASGVVIDDAAARMISNLLTAPLPT